MKERTARYAKAGVIQSEGGLLVLRKLHGYPCKRAPKRPHRSEPERGGADNLSLCAPVARVFTVATGNVVTVKQVVNVNANR